MRPAKLISGLLLTIILLVVIGFGAAYVWGKRQAEVGYMGEWRLSVDAMAEAMVAKGYSMIEVRKFYTANRGGLTRMTVEGDRIVRRREGKTSTIEYSAKAGNPGCWSISLSGGTNEKWCIVGGKLHVSSASGDVLIFRAEGTGNMKSDTAPLQ